MVCFEQRIRMAAHDFTKTEKKIAEYMLEHKRTLLFENATSLAKKIDTTAMTVGRFLRSIGFQGMEALHKDLHAELLVSVQPVSERFKSLDERSKPILAITECMRAEIEGITAVYEMMSGSIWAETVKTIQSSHKIFVASFATLEGVADSFVARMRYVRPDVQAVHGHDGMFIDVFGDETAGKCLILIEDRRYAQTALKLAALCKDRNIPLILITDEFCLWGDEYTHLHLSVQTKMPVFWTSLAPMVCLLNHLVNALMQENDEELSMRMDRIGKLQEHFKYFEE